MVHYKIICFKIGILCCLKEHRYERVVKNFGPCSCFGYRADPVCRHPAADCVHLAVGGYMQKTYSAL